MAMQAAFQLGRFVGGIDQGSKIMIYNFLMWWHRAAIRERLDRYS
jgi:hypothetical protein